MKTVALLSLVHTLRKWKATDPTLGIQCRRAHEERAVENSSLTVPEKKRKKIKNLRHWGWGNLTGHLWEKKMGPSAHLRFGTKLIST